MPIYEFVCRPCNTIYSFHSFTVATDRIPTCPKCGASDLHRVPSRFGVSAKTTNPSTAGDEDNGLDDPRVEREMMRFAAELEQMDENDPRAMAAAVRRMTEIAGEEVTPAMEEMIRRLEAGEDPEKVEEELGDAIEDEMGDLDGGAGFSGAAPSRDSGLYPM
jgi:putative FmdB family regulatory protein